MKFALTGAGGFLGQSLIPKLVAMSENAQVVAYTSQPAAALYRHERVDYDVRRSATVAESMDGVDVLIHAAFPRASDGGALSAGLEYTHGTFQAAAQGGVQALVNISSQSVYTSSRVAPATEDSPIAPDTSYGLAKRSSELIAQSVSSKLRTVSLRMANLIGPKFDQRVLNRMIAGALGTGSIDVSSPTTTVDQLDFRDAAGAIVAVIAAQGWDSHGVVNIGSGQPVALDAMGQRVGALVEQITGARVTVTTDARTPGTNSALDIDRFRSITDFEPQFTLEDTAAEIVQTFLDSTNTA